MAHPRRWLLVAVAPLIIAGTAVTVWGFSLGLSAETLMAWIEWLGIWAPIGFVMLYALATVALVRVAPSYSSDLRPTHRT